ncbi:MAG TPA: urea carboxylase-associated family protein [Stellaceae bacterium]|nr:urea carboxylase-associated family protein [Stellaceae bacterium]
MPQITIPARKGKAAFVKAGQRVKVINTHGQQVVDTWAFNRAELTEFMSMEHTRSHLLKVIPAVGDQMLSNRRRPILTFTEDDSGGIHDMLLAACDRHRYRLLGFTEHHDNCTDNLADALRELGLAPPETPSPLNLFMNIPVRGNQLAFEPAVAKPGSHVTLRAEMDLVIAFSACPQDVIPINGLACKPVEAHFEILD